MTASFVVTAFQHVNRTGNGTLFGISKGARYNPVRDDRLEDIGFDAMISSVEVFASNPGRSALLLFSNRHTVGPFSFDMGNFNWEFCQIVNPGPGSMALNLTDHAFNDRTRSLMLVNTFKGPEFRVSFRDRFLNTWRTTLDAQLGSQASRIGDPTMTWEMFPEGISYLDSGLTYLKIYQRLNINVDWWPDYEASMTYHIFLYLDGANRLRGYVARWAAWVEGGAYSGQIFDRLWPQVVSGVAKIEEQLTSGLSGVPALEDFYYLPGRQLTAKNGVTKGFTTDDVTIVAQL